MKNFPWTLSSKNFGEPGEIQHKNYLFFIYNNMLQYLFKQTPIKRVDYEDIIHAIKHPESFLIINTLPIGEQQVLIKGTISYIEEETTINSFITNYTMDAVSIIIYGKNANDESAEKKYRQIQSLGFRDVFLYSGGLFEWILLQDIFGEVNFPTIGKVENLLKYKAPSMISQIVYRKNPMIPWK